MEKCICYAYSPMSVSRRLCSVLERLLLGDFRHPQEHYVALLRSYMSPETRWLDLGTGHQVLPPWLGLDEQEFVGRVALAVGVDLDRASLARHTCLRNLVAADLKQLPFADASFSLLSANMVMEHVDDPQVVLREAGRVLDDGGYFVVHTPNLLSYSGVISHLLPYRVKTRLANFLQYRCAGDVHPTLYRFNTVAKVKRLARRCGFEVVEIDLVGTVVLTRRLGLLALPEVFLLKLLTLPPLRNFRGNILAVLRKPAAHATGFDESRKIAWQTISNFGQRDSRAEGSLHTG